MAASPPRSGMRPLALAAALVLHVLLIAAIVSGLSERIRGRPVRTPVEVALLSPPKPRVPAPPPPSPSVAAPPPVPTPVPPQPAPHPEKTTETKKPEVKKAEVKKVKPKPIHRHAPEPRKHREPHIEDQPKPRAPTEQPAAAATAPAAPALARPPVTSSAPSDLPPAVEPAPRPAVRTGVSISASYAASNVAPRYPRMSLINQEQGTVLLRVLVQPDGSAGAVEIKTSSGYPLLDQAAQSAVRHWRFNPATIDGKPIAEWYQVPVRFKLPDN